ncbi:AAA family ATPase [Candidatus Azambacteria bacterium]|nr:AAA family ATPase [Candidatus Azambacteria bacterium]MBI3685473.1 AAA family ATPase [Candidatus Azambacteria bacterium]
MYLKSITVKNFKKFADITVAFPSDITVIKGPNEQGKSTLLSAIIAGLFYDPKKSNKDILELRSWNSDKLYEITMDIEHQGEAVRLYKNFETKELLLENSSAKKKLTTFGAIEAYLHEIGALRDRALFEHTACVRHDALSLITEGKREISQALQELLTSSGEHVSSDKVLKKIQAIVTDIQRGTKQQAKNPGQLRLIEHEIAQLAQKRDALKTELDAVGSKSEYLGTVSDRYHIAVRECEAKKMQYERNAVYFGVAEELKKIHAQFDRLSADVNALKEIEEKKKKIRADLAAREAVASFDVRKWDAQKQVIGVKKERLAHLETEARQMKAEGKPSRVHMKPAHLILSLVLFAAGFSGFMYTKLFLLWILFAAAFAYSFIFKHGLVAHTQKGVGTDASGLAHEIAVLEKQLEKILRDNGVAGEEELMKKKKEFDALTQELVRLESREEGMLRSRSFADVQREQSEYAKRIVIEEAKITDEEKVSPPAPPIQRSLEIDIAHFKKEAEESKREMEQVAADVRSSRADHEAVAAIEEEIEYKEAQKARIGRKVRTLEILTEALFEAQVKTIEKSRKAIEEYMRTYLLVVTDGRYDKVKVKDDLSFEVWSEEKKGMIVPEEHLSKGTIDQFYLIARFAVLDLLNKGVKSLVLLDDPFSGFDTERRVRAREMLKDMTDKFQIIMFTHSADYKGWGNVVEI